MTGAEWEWWERVASAFRGKVPTAVQRRERLSLFGRGRSWGMVAASVEGMVGSVAGDL
jgi:hypothetical protein